MSWKTNRASGKKFQQKGKGIDSRTKKSLDAQDVNRRGNGDYFTVDKFFEHYAKEWEFTAKAGQRITNANDMLMKLRLKGLLDGKTATTIRRYLNPKIAIGKWILRDNRDPRLGFVWQNKDTDEILTIRQGPDNDWSASILGAGRYQREYLTGGNSQIHNANVKLAFDKAYDYMLGFR